MKKLMALVFVVLAVSPLQSFALPYPGAPYIDEFFGMSARPYSRIEVSDLTLDQEETIRADEVVLTGRIETRGHRLVIDARRLEFKPGASIFGFSESQGLPGGDGMKNPGPMMIFAAETVGLPRISGVGQMDGVGADGGQGGNSTSNLFFSAHALTAEQPNAILLQDLSFLEEKRLELIRKWYAFHWARQLYIAFSASEEMIELITEDLDDAEPEIAEIIGQKMNAAIQDLQEEWLTHVFNPINGLKNEHALVVQRDRILDIAKPLMDVQNRMKSRDPLSINTILEFNRAFLLAKELLSSRIDEVSENCSSYLTDLSKISSLIEITSHFEVPVCRSLDTLRKYPLREFTTIAPYDAVAPSRLKFENLK